MKTGKFGKFEIEAELGQGAMGQVYLATDPILDRKVALKTVAPALLTGQDTLSRFQREARAAARLQHPNIVTIFEVGEVEGTHYIAMEFVEGIDLGEAMVPPSTASRSSRRSAWSWTSAGGSTSPTRWGSSTGT